MDPGNTMTGGNLRAPSHAFTPRANPPICMFFLKVERNQCYPGRNPCGRKQNMWNSAPEFELRLKTGLLELRNGNATTLPPVKLAFLFCTDLNGSISDVDDIIN